VTCLFVRYRTLRGEPLRRKGRRRRFRTPPSGRQMSSPVRLMCLHKEFQLVLATYLITLSVVCQRARNGTLDYLPSGDQPLLRLLRVAFRLEPPTVFWRNGCDLELEFSIAQWLSSKSREVTGWYCRQLPGSAWPSTTVSGTVFVVI
jgi:hypothetical protein